MFEAIGAWWRGMFGRPPEPAAPVLDPIEAELSAEMASVRWARQEVLPKMDGWHAAKLKELLDRSERILPRLAELERAGALLDGERSLFRRMVASYLPESSRAFMRLSVKVARKTRKEGKSPSELFCEQLEMMRLLAARVEKGFDEEAVGALAAQGNFLRERIGEPGWDERKFK